MATRYHGDRKGRHYHTTPWEAALFVYSSGDPGGRHARLARAMLQVQRDERRICGDFWPEQQAKTADRACRHLKNDGSLAAAPGRDRSVEVRGDAGLYAKCVPLCCLQLVKAGCVHNRGFARVGDGDGQADPRRGSVGSRLFAHLPHGKGAVRELDDLARRGVRSRPWPRCRRSCGSGRHRGRDLDDDWARTRRAGLDRSRLSCRGHAARVVGAASAATGCEQRQKCQ